MSREGDVTGTPAGESGAQEATPDLLRVCRNVTERSPLPMLAAEGVMHIVRYVNPAFCSLSGRESADLIGRPFAEAVPEGEANGCAAFLDRVYRTGTTETLSDQEHGFPFLLGVYWSYMAWAILDAHDRPAGVMV